MKSGSFIKVLLPLRLEWIPCYACEFPVQRGSRVLVDFARREYIGVVVLTDVEPEVDESRISCVKALADGLPPVSEQELKFWEFLSSYYLCTLGEVYKAAYPVTKLRSEQNAAAVAKRTDERRKLSQEKMLAGFQARMLRLDGRLARQEAELERRRASTRANAEITARLQASVEQLREEKRSLQASADALSAKLSSAASASDPVGTPSQSCRDSAAEWKPPVFLGDPSDAELVERARSALEQGRDVLVLVPEIALGNALAGSFAQAFPGSVLTMTSQNTAVQRRRVADSVRSSGDAVVVVGTRVSLFLPFRDLGLVIVTGEQDESYKQSEPAPRYNTRDAAVMLGRIHGAEVMLCSPFPSFETLGNVLSGKYRTGLASLYSVPSGFEIVDISKERRKNGMIGNFSRKLLKAIAEAAGPVALIRGWEKEAELMQEAADLLPGRELRIMTFAESRHADMSAFSLVAVMQADVLLAKEDFRTDERAAQRLAMLGKQCSGTRLIVQTSRSEHPLFTGMDLNSMLEERRTFALPPYSRLVDVVFCDPNEARKSLMMNRFALRDAMPLADRLRLSLPMDATLSKRKSTLWQRVLAFEKENRYQGCIFLDVDPL